MVTRTISHALVSIFCLFTVVWGSVSFAQETRGIKYNNLTVSPYVNLDYTYDSNVDYGRGAAEVADQILNITPGVDLTYTGNEWGLSGNAWYGYDKYIEYDELDADRYGESLQFYRESAKGWRLLLGQSYIKSSQNDSILDGGRGLWRDRDQFDLNGALSYQLSERTGITLSGLYSQLSYANDSKEYAPLYGMEEWTAGLEFSRKLTEKSNLLLSGTYSQYISDGATMVDDGSTGYSLMAGFGSRATRRITYRVMTGVEWFDYGDEDLLMGWTYSLGANWMINRKLSLSVSGSSHYQPSEYQANQVMQVYALSSGLTYHPMGKLTTRFDVAIRREENEYDFGKVDASTDDEVSARFRADYQLMRHVTMYGGLEYEDQMSDNEDLEFDRYRASLGLQFRY